MNLTNRELYDFLKFNGIKYLYHVTTISTAIGFIKHGGFISRKLAKDMDISYILRRDEAFYEEFDIYNDIFFNSFDLHIFYKRPNYFGNVTFLVTIDILIDDDMPSIVITKNNPLYWNKSIKHIYYDTIDEYIKDFYNAMNNLELYQQMYYAFKHCNDIIPFGKYLKTIIVDNPHYSFNRQDIFKPSFKRLKKVVRESKLKADLIERKCPSNCMCTLYYHDLEEVDLLRIYDYHP